MTTYPAGTRGDGILVEVSGAEVLMLAASGAVPGAIVLAVGGENGPGAGTLRQLADLTLQWRAPSSASFGEAINVSAGGSFVLEDGDSADSWVRVSVSVAYQAAGAIDAVVNLQERHNAAGPDDVTAAEASSGSTETFTATLTNQSGARVDGLVAWLNAATPDLEISDDGATWVSPTTFGTALALDAALEPGDTDTLHFRRTIGASSPSDVEVINLTHLSWIGI